MGGFASAFRARLGADRELGSAPDTALATALATARDPWPGFAVDEAELADHLAGLVADAPAPVAALAALNLPDLYLAVACARGIAGALAVFDRDYLTPQRGTLARMGLGASAIDETLQVMRDELLAARPDARPRILNYGGRGQLRGWLRSVAARTGLRTGRDHHGHAELDERIHAPTAGDLELDYMKKTYGEAFRRAFHLALSGLGSEDRLLLKQRFRHRLTVEELGALHSVNPGTISRWVAAARERLVVATRTEMMRELGIDRGDVSSILRMIHSEIDISLSLPAS